MLDYTFANDRSKSMELMTGVYLARYRGPDFVRLMSVRKGHDGCENAVYEIEIRKTARTATVKVNDKVIFTMSGSGTGSCMLEKLAIESLRRFCRERKSANVRSRESRKRKRSLQGICQEIDLACGCEEPNL